MAGNTGFGIYKEWLPEDHLIDVKEVPELRRLSLSKVPCHTTRESVVQAIMYILLQQCPRQYQHGQMTVTSFLSP